METKIRHSFSMLAAVMLQRTQFMRKKAVGQRRVPKDIVLGVVEKRASKVLVDFFRAVAVKRELRESVVRRVKLNTFEEGLLKAFAKREVREVFLRRRVMLEREFLIAYFSKGKKHRDICKSLVSIDLAKLQFKIQDYIELGYLNRRQCSLAEQVRTRQSEL